MKRFLFLIFWVYCQLSFPQNGPFNTILKANKRIDINRSFHKNDSVIIDIDKVYGLSLNGVVIQSSDDSFIRVIAQDKEGKCYNVMECGRITNINDTIILNNYCEETAYLNGFAPSVIKFYVKDAVIKLNSINYVTTSKEDNSLRLKSEDVFSLRKCQVQHKVDLINENNKKKGKLWFAGVTDIAMKDYEERKRILGLEDGSQSYGIEYYVGGILDVGGVCESRSSASLSNSNVCVDSFDWRNRHGKNWMTSVKNQLNSGYCVAFAICSMLESGINLYYNQMIDYDLSEQDIVFSYHRRYNRSIPNIYNHGMNLTSAMNCVLQEGVLEEDDVPFVDDANISVPTLRNDSDALRISSFGNVITSINNIDSIKKAIIKHGPLLSGINTSASMYVQAVSGSHAMALVGFHTIHVGDIITQVKPQELGGIFDTIRVQANSPYIGKVYWVFKDNYGEDKVGVPGGYYNIVFTNYNCMLPAYHIGYPIVSPEFSDDDVVISDDDGDGFYFWGIGQKPANCPSWIPDLPDGDDSDSTKGPMDEYGNLMELNPDLNDIVYIDSDSICSNRVNVYNHTIIKNGGRLSLCDDVTFYGNSRLTIEGGGNLIVNNAVINNANISVENGANVTLLNGGRINVCTNQNFCLPLGATMNIESGTINNNP